MPRSDDIYRLPVDLPVPIDDGACRHLPGTRLPPVILRSTSGRDIKLAELEGRTIVYCYPRTGRPGEDLPVGWNDIPGARGCTPETCAFRDHYQELRAFATDVFGLSTQESAYQQEVVERLHLPFELLSDAGFELTNALRLPTFEIAGMKLLRRLTLVIRDGCVEKVFYPIFPPDKHAEEVLDWLSTRG